MRIEDFDWEVLYKKADNFMKSIKAKEHNVATNEQTLFRNKPIVMVCFPKRINAVAIMMLDKNSACTKLKGYKENGILYCRYSISVEQLNC